MTFSSSSQLLDQLVAEFEQIVGLNLRLSDEFREEALRLTHYLSNQTLLPFSERRCRFLAHVNWKFRVNADGLRKFYALAAKRGYTFNYHQKKSIQLAFDIRSEQQLLSVIEAVVPDRKTRHQLMGAFSPIDDETTISILQNECRNPSRLRRPKGERDIEREILEAQFAAFLFCSLEQKEMHRFFDPKFDENTYQESFWKELHVRYPELFNRDHTLYILRISSAYIIKDSYPIIRDQMCSWISNTYQQINNYGYLAILIEPIKIEGQWRQWELAADLTLFAEKHREVPLHKTYFRKEEIARITTNYIDGLDKAQARFDLANEGFTYKDCFVLVPGEEPPASRATLLLLFQKNDRDETLIPCPACRSQQVQGNSYPTLGVRSWECRSRLCPDRSKYNRGKRYSFKGLLMQQAIDDERNEIPVSSVREWDRDVQYGRSQAEVLDMLVRHYSLYGDTIHIFNWACTTEILGRRVIVHSLTLGAQHKKATSFFEEAPWFRRYLVKRKSVGSRCLKNLGDEEFVVYCGDAFDVLSQLPDEIFDGAVTSPPYYNAREYAQWDNVYCYLYDMYNINLQVFRCLKRGALYLFNIFDYFDNEKTIVFSAMGQRRMILSAYIVDMFRRIGFVLLGNIAWDKGDIEGKRGFNAGNFSPYYQSPFNCWEHILVFCKPPTTNSRIVIEAFPAVLRAKPVIKMVRGRNTHGHTAPFPDAVPELLVTKLRRGARVLDPFAGSLTTGRVAERFGLKSVQIERSREYCELGLLMRENERQVRLAAAKQPKQRKLPFG